ncbi:hypothetical protein EV360DRAFT_87701 [Lentinula raphanica]|nr:hypothetical protein EV360DRAFT_87701 [Lentinula raphanica]
MRRSLQLDEVVDVDNTGKIIGIPEINVDGSKGQNDYLEGVNGSLGEVAPWMESPPSPLTPLPTKRGFGLSVAGLGSNVSFSSLHQERDAHYMHSQHGSESTLAFPHPLSTTTSLTSEQPQSLRKSKSFLPLHNGKSSTLNLPGTSSPPSSAGVAKSMLMPFSTLINAEKEQESTESQDARGLRPKTPPLSEFPAYASSVTVNMITPNRQINGNSRKKTGGSHPRLWQDKDRDKSYGDISAPIPPPKDGQDEDLDVVMKLDTNLDQMEGIVDTSVLNSGSPGMGALTSKGSSIHTLNQSISDDRHSQHSHPHPTNNQYSSLGPISHSEFNKPFSSFSSQSTGSISPPLFTPHSSVSPYSSPSSASPPPRSSSLAHLNTIDRKISPRTILPTQQQHNKFREGLQPGLNVMIPPTSTNGLHGGLDNTGGANGRSASNVPAISSNQSSSSSQLHDNDATPPGEHEAEEEYYSSSEDSLLHNLAPGSIGSRSIGPGGGGRPLEFAKSGRGDLGEDDDEVDMLVVQNGAGGLNGVDEHGRRIERQQPGSVASLRSFSTNTSHYGSISTSAYGSQYPLSFAGSITSVTSYANLNLNGGRKESSYSYKKARKLIPHPRKNSKGDTTSETHHIYGDTDTTRLGSKLELNLSLSSLNSSINQRRPSHPPYSSSSRQQLLPPQLFSQNSHLIQGSSSQNGTSETPSRFRIRIHRANNTYHIVSSAKGERGSTAAGSPVEGGRGSTAKGARASTVERGATSRESLSG